MKIPNFEIFIPFKGKNQSGYYEDNLLIRYKNIYIMDNHRLALWCWCQQLNLSNKYNLLHIDKHNDLLYCYIDDWISELKNFNYILNLKLNDYRENKNFSLHFKTLKLFRCDNYLTIFLLFFFEYINKIYFFTYEEKFKILDLSYKKIINLEKIKVIVEKIINNKIFDIAKIQNIIESGENWIINIDLDYFFCDKINKESTIFNSYDLISNLFDLFIKNLNSRISILTISLSPEYCCNNNNSFDLEKGWNNSLEMIKMIFAKLNLPYDRIFK